MKTRNLAGCAALLAAVILGGCAMSLGVDELLSPSRGAAIAGEDLRYYFLEPVTGDTPKTRFDASHYRGIVAWAPSPPAEVFEADKVYTATVTLHAVSGYDFTGTPAAPEPGSFRHTGTGSENVIHGSGSGGTLTISIVFNPTGPAAEISRDLQRYVPVPVADIEPVRSGTRSGLEVEAKWEVWNNGRWETFNGKKFEAGATYRANITLKAKYPCRFDPDRPVMYVDATKVEETLSGPEFNEAATEERLSVSYKATEAAETLNPEDCDLTPYIPTPVAAGKTASLDFVALKGYTGTVAWKLLASETDLVGTTMPGNLFQPEAFYRADVDLYAAVGFTLKGAEFTYSSGGTLQAAGDLAPDGNSLTGLKIAFPKTGKLVVSDLDLTNKVPRPVTGGTPVVYISGPQYTGTVAWTPHSGLFGPGTVYTAVVSLIAAQGYAFDGLGAAPASPCFTHTGGGTVSHGAVEAAAGTLEVSVDFPATAPDAAVSDLDLTQKVPRPVTGGTPVTSFAWPQYTGTVAWSGGDPTGSIFTSGQTYTAVVTLTAASGWTFGGVKADSFEHTAAAAITNPEKSGVVTITFPATTGGVTAQVVDDVDLKPYIPAPVRGGTPVMYFAGPQYTGTVAWTNSTDNNTPHSGVFGANTEYKATVVLTAASGYTFTGFTGPFKHDGASSLLNAANPLGVAIVFGNTGTIPAATVSDLDLTNKVPRPVIGETPVTLVSGPQYAGTVAWTNVTDNDSHAGLFGPGTVYQAVVTLTAASGWTLDGAIFSHYAGVSLISATYDGGAGVSAVTITFKATPDNVQVTDLDLTLKVPRPVNGGIPVTTVFGPQYAAGVGSVSWDYYRGPDYWPPMPSGNFDKGVVYRVRITLAPAAGYAFDRLGAAAFTHSGADTTPSPNPSFAADTGIVTVIFPATTGVTTQVVDDVNLKPYIPAPVRGGTPVMSFAGPQYTGTVAWTNSTDNNTPHSGVFGAETKYKATVVLTAASGYTFTGFTGTFEHGTETVSANAGPPMKVEIVFGETGTILPAAVSDLNLTPYIPAPVTGGTPLMYFAGPQYRGTVAWTKETGGSHTGLFGPGTVYKAELTLTAASGYTLDGLVPDAFTHSGAGTVSTDTGPPVKVEITFTATAHDATVSDLNLTPYIPAPVTGGTPLMYFAGPQYRGTVAWTKETGGSHTGLFGPGTVYKAELTLTAASGYTFTGFTGPFTHSGAGTVSTDTGPPVKVEITFTATVADATVSGLDLTPYIPAPVTGGTPVTSFAGPQYRGTVAWTKAGGPHTGLFGPGTEYKAELTLTAASGYTFTGFTGSFTHGTETVSTLGGDPMKVEITFTATADDTTVSGLDLTPYIPVPVTGGMPATSFAGPQYTGTVAWTNVTDGGIPHPPTGPFGVKKAYKATVTLTAASGWTFAGVGANSFKHGTLTAPDITNGKDSGVVAINFPLTAGPVTYTATYFGSTKTTADSALYHMDQIKDGGPLTVTLTAATEDLTANVLITRAAGAENAPRNVTIDGGGLVLNTTRNNSLTLTGDGTEDGLVVTLKNITIQGTSGRNSPLVRIEGQARLILGYGAVIQGNTSIVNGGGVHIEGTGSVLEMGAGSKIKDNHVTSSSNLNGGACTITAGP